MNQQLGPDIRLTPRSARLRRQAHRSHPIVARAYRRRACELEFAAWLIDTVSGRHEPLLGD